MGLSGPYSELIYHDNMVYKGRIDSSTTTKIENYDALILGAFIKYHYIGIYNDVFPKGSFFIVLFLFHGAYLKYHCLILPL